MSPHVRVVVDGEIVQDGPMSTIEDLQGIRVFSLETLEALMPSDSNERMLHEMLGVAWVAALGRCLEGDRTTIFNITTDMSGWTLNVETMRPSFD